MNTTINNQPKSKFTKGQAIEILCHFSIDNTERWMPGIFICDVSALDRDYRINCSINNGAELTEIAPECVRSADINDWSRWNQQDLNPGQKIEISEDIYDHLLNCLPPRNWKGGYFEVGEADHHANNGRAIHRACWKENGKYYTGYPQIK